MTSSKSAMSDLSQVAGTDASLGMSLRDIHTVALKKLIEAELAAVIGAALNEHTPQRMTRSVRVLRRCAKDGRTVDYLATIVDEF